MSRKKQLVLLIVCVCLLVFALVCGGIMAWLGGILQSQRADERWRGESETRFAQVSCFFPVGAELDANTLYSFRRYHQDNILLNI